MAVLGGGAAREVGAEVVDGGLVGAEGLDPGAGAVGEADDLAEGDALGLDLVEGLAAVEHGLVEPAPGPLPRPARVDGERVEHDGEGGEAAEGRLRLRLEVGDEVEEALHGPALQCLHGTLHHKTEQKLLRHAHEHQLSFSMDHPQSHKKGPNE